MVSGGVLLVDNHGVQVIYPVAVTVAGVDPSGGAGIAADLKAFAAMGVHGAVVVAVVTVQDTRGVRRVHVLPSWLVEEQLQAVLEDYRVGAVKTGVLGSRENVEAIARLLRGRDIALVVDPVYRASAGQLLNSDDAFKAIVEELFPLASLVAPNVPEAERITGTRIRSIEDAKRAARILVEDYGARAALIKGGHLPGEPVDVLYYEDVFWEFRGERRSGCSHGTGCTFTAALAAGLAKGLDLVEAVVRARKLVEEAIEYGFRVGRGDCPVNPLAGLERDAERYRAIAAVEDALRLLLENASRVARYAPEVGMNIAYAIEPRLARSIGDVAGVMGRIVRYGDTLKPVGPVRMGASSHMARLVLAAMERDPSLRAALNIRYAPELIEAARRTGLRVVYVDRRAEPEEVRRVEGASMRWLVERAFAVAGATPDVVYDTGDVGKEAMIRILARTPREAIEKLLRILEALEGRGGMEQEEA
ncbi:bifunctional hydroxymethylpyrimidine kinase/phosphomethylpyrimidine kinase [Hyperthermus butylicus]|uniref:Multidomain protein n=1 Tax=Hyperthermus butylicus (strain DSM 5456 / JCM 9403 / PLM1-5) TaxID=415426 RepID=A2BMS2_HYPBU|nr:bifunctional hydroxymethylpyrimidine kinase/phosphomethylpyrimidine kinase [Hyperthermus butylicus]ABM81283.1 Multidomain protein [Hyperthermus butylicus DSM 5456]